MKVVTILRSWLALALLSLALLLAFATPASADPGDSGWSQRTMRGADPGDGGWR